MNHSQNERVGAMNWKSNKERKNLQSFLRAFSFCRWRLTVSVCDGGWSGISRIVTSVAQATDVTKAPVPEGPSDRRERSEDALLSVRVVFCHHENHSGANITLSVFRFFRFQQKDDGCRESPSASPSNGNLHRKSVLDHVT